MINLQTKNIANNLYDRSQCNMINVFILWVSVLQFFLYYYWKTALQVINKSLFSPFVTYKHAFFTIHLLKSTMYFFLTGKTSAVSKPTSCCLLWENSEAFSKIQHSGKYLRYVQNDSVCYKNNIKEMRTSLCCWCS